MKHFAAKEVFKHVLAWLKENNLPTSKIAMQKSLFFLQEKGVCLALDFEPYSYGPFSRQIMKIASEQERCGAIRIQRTEYEVCPEFTDDLRPEEKRKIDVHLNRLKELLNQNFSFDNLELTGTVLYCIQALKENGLSVDRESVLSEFKTWKGRKYSDTDIWRVYDVLVEDFVVSVAA